MYATPTADPLRTTVFTPNVTSIIDYPFTGNRSFTYDDLNRLAYGSGTFGPGQSQANCSHTHNAIGNLTNAAKVGANKHFYHNDHLGGVNVITDITGARCQLNEYDPWGAVSRSEGPTPGSPANCDTTRRFTGQELDPETDLYYYGGRYYDHEIGRFVSPDPFVQDPDDPQNLNRYSYVINNPWGGGGSGLHR